MITKENTASIILFAAASALCTVAWPIALGINLNESVKIFFNSTFVITSFSTFFAAFFGAWGAQHIIERKTLLQEIRNTNAAIATSFTICSGLIGFKKQHVRSIFDKFAYDSSVYDSVVQNARSLPIGKAILFKYEGDFRVLQFSKLPTESLQAQVFEKISALGRPLALAITLNQSANSLNDCIKMRNDLIADFKSKNIKDEKLAEIYFGQKTEGGQDSTFPDLINAIYNQLDDCIFFSELLCKDLQDHGEQIKKKIQKNAPRISKPDFKQAYDEGLMPDTKPYESWYTSFSKKE